MTDNYRLNGGASRDRTDDPLLAKQVLSQLSYGPLTCLFLAMLRCCSSISRSHTGVCSFLLSSRALPSKKNPASGDFLALCGYYTFISRHLVKCSILCRIFR